MDVFNRGSAVMMWVIGDSISGLKPVVNWWMVLPARDLVDAQRGVHAPQWISNQWAGGLATRSIG
jgi:hypothetical protein